MTVDKSRNAHTCPGQSLALAVPAYNAARYLPRLFESVAAQTTPFDEIWVYDDASSDNTGEVAKSFGAQVVRGGVNRERCAAKNTLLERVGCEWIHFHDADDVLAPEFVARAKARIARESFDALLFDYEFRFDDGSEENSVLLFRTDLSHSSLVDHPLAYMLTHTLHHTSGVYSVPFLRGIGGFDTDPAVLYNEERAFHFRVAENGARFAFEPYVGSLVLQRADCMWEKDKVKCCIAGHGITKRFTERHPGRYPDEVIDHSWHIANTLAPFLEWTTVDSCLSLARAYGGRLPSHGGLDFKILCAINPHLAVRVREWWVRLIKPGLRKNYPVWRFELWRNHSSARA